MQIDQAQSKKFIGGMNDVGVFKVQTLAGTGS